MILIDAIYINKGGGAVLLQYLIESVFERQLQDRFYFLLDPRFDKPDILKGNYEIVPNKLSSRISFYKAHKTSYSTVFCFANTPPPIRLKCRVYTYFHNQKVIEAPQRKFESNYRKIYLKYLFVKLWTKNTDYYIVQTPHMVELMVRSGLKASDHVLTIPFYNSDRYKQPSPAFDTRPENSFVFVSTPSPQKNYPTLLDCWNVLHEQGIDPELHITVDETAPALLQRIEEMKKKGIKIFNYSYLDPKDLYFKYRYLICPSVMESFGLPLIEAVDSGMKVLAPNLQYVFDVIKPSATFDPMDKNDMANCVIKAVASKLAPSEIVTKNDINKLLETLEKKLD